MPLRFTYGAPSAALRQPLDIPAGLDVDRRPDREHGEPDPVTGRDVEPDERGGQHGEGKQVDGQDIADDDGGC